MCSADYVIGSPGVVCVSTTAANPRANTGADGYDRTVLRGSCTEGRSFIAFYFQGDRLLAADVVNQPREYMAIRKALAAGKNADPSVLQDPGSDLATAFA